MPKHISFRYLARSNHPFRELLKAECEECAKCGFIGGIVVAGIIDGKW